MNDTKKIICDMVHKVAGAAEHCKVLCEDCRDKEAVLALIKKLDDAINCGLEYLNEKK